MIIPPVIKNGAIYIFANVFNKAIGLITLPIFARILTTKEFGIFSTYSSWCGTLAVIVGLSLGGTIRNAYVDMKNELGQFISSIFSLALINFLFICIIVIFFTKNISFPHNLVWLCLIEAFNAFIINSIIFKFMMEEKAMKRTCLMVLPNFIAVLCSLIMIFFMDNNKHYARIIPACFVISCFGVAILIYYFAKYRCFISKKYWSYALPISIPLTFHGISNCILAVSDRSIISYYCSASDTGIYSLVYNLSITVSVLTSSAESVWIPKMTRTLQNCDYKKFNSDLLPYIYTVLLMFCSILTISPELLLYVGGEKYLPGVNMIYPLFSSAFILFTYSIYVNIEYFYKKTNMIAIATVVSALLNLGLNIVFIPKYGRTAAAYTTLISYFVSFILHSSNARRLNNVIAAYRVFIIPITIMAVSGFVITWLRENILARYAVMTLIIILECCLILFYLRKRK